MARPDFSRSINIEAEILIEYPLILEIFKSINLIFDFTKINKMDYFLGKIDVMNFKYWKLTFTKELQLFR